MESTQNISQENVQVIEPAIIEKDMPKKHVESDDNVLEKKSEEWKEDFSSDDDSNPRIVSRHFENMEEYREALSKEPSPIALLVNNILATERTNPSLPPQIAPELANNEPFPAPQKNVPGVFSYASIVSPNAGKAPVVEPKPAIKENEPVAQEENNSFKTKAKKPRKKPQQQKVAPEPQNVPQIETTRKSRVLVADRLWPEQASVAEASATVLEPKKVVAKPSIGVKKPILAKKKENESPNPLSTVCIFLEKCRKQTCERAHCVEEYQPNPCSHGKNCKFLSTCRFYHPNQDKEQVFNINYDYVKNTSFPPKPRATFV